MMQTSLLPPVIALILWSLAVLLYAVIRRLRAMRASGIDLGALVGTKTGDADRVMRGRSEWPVHNYNHLMEQPTLFYATAFVATAAGAAGGWAVAFAWGYVALRVLHTVEQVTTNRVRVRFVLFVAATACLVLLALHTAGAVLRG